MNPRLFFKLFLFSKIRESCDVYSLQTGLYSWKKESLRRFFDVTLALIGLSDKAQLATHSRVLFNSSSLYLNLSALFIGLMILPPLCLRLVKNYVPQELGVLFP